MKNYRMLIPIVLAVILVASWYMLISNTSKEEERYQQYLTEARHQAKMGVPIKAVENYTEAMKIKKSPELYAEVAKLLKTQGKPAVYLSWCEAFMNDYAKEPLAYESLLEAYYRGKDYESCFDVITRAKKRNVSSPYLTQIETQLKYEFSLDYNTYVDVGVFSNNYCAVKKKESWGFVTRFGEQRIYCKYEAVGAFTQAGYASVVSDGSAYLINKKGEKSLGTNIPYLRFGQLVDDLVPAQREDGRYLYLNSRMETAFGDYEYATSFNGGIAAVKNNGQWYFINANGEKAFDGVFRDVILDEKEIAFRADRAFVSDDGKNDYYMIDSAGKRVGNLTFEGAKTFASEGPAAVQIEGKWCFVNTSGERTSSEHTYEAARSYQNDLAAVQINGKWGFVDRNESIAIEPQFEGAKDFNEKGSCFVKIGDSWQLLKLYRLNREE